MIEHSSLSGAQPSDQTNITDHYTTPPTVSLCHLLLLVRNIYQKDEKELQLLIEGYGRVPTGR